MIVDSSALVAILRGEPDQADFATAIARAGGARLSAASYLETAIVIGRARDPFLAANDIVVEAVISAQARIAREAYRDFGTGPATRLA